MYKLLMVIIAIALSSRADSQVSNTERMRIYKGFIRDAKSVARKSRDKEAKKIVKVLKNAEVFEPNKFDINFLDEGKKVQGVGIVILFPQDADANYFWKCFYGDTSACAFFLPEIKSIVVRSTIDFGELARGLVYLHEGKHAANYLVSPRYCTSSDSADLEEVSAYDMETRLLKKIGGKKYQKYLKLEIDSVKELIDNFGGKVGHNYAIVGSDIKVDCFFKSSFTKAEKDYLRFIFNISLNFGLIEKYYSGNIQETKARFYRKISPVRIPKFLPIDGGTLMMK